MNRIAPLILSLLIIAGCAASPRQINLAPADTRVDFTTLAASRARPQLKPAPYRAATAAGVPDAPLPVPTTGRGPIGCVVLANTAWRSDANPRGWSPYWLHKSGMDVRSPDYAPKFRDNLLAHARWIIAFGKRANFRRFLVWDIEGQELDHWESYVGDGGRTLPPEMQWKGPDGLTTAQAYFKLFRDAGMSVGGTIRPTVLRAVPYGANRLRNQADTSYGWQQVSIAPPLDVVSGKTGYAYLIYHWTEIYLDSSLEDWAWDNNGPDPTFGKPFWTELARRYPDVCYHPEFGPRDGTSLPNCQPYVEWRKGDALPASPASIGVSPYNVDASDPQVKAALKQAGKRGIDLMVSADQPLAADNVAAQCAAWREGAGQ
jgi:hypothetical protein